MNRTTKSDFDVHQYLRWLAEAIDIKPGADIATNSLSSGASVADADAIALGVANYRASSLNAGNAPNYSGFFASSESHTNKPTSTGTHGKRHGIAVRFTIAAVVAALVVACVFAVVTTGGRARPVSNEPEPKSPETVVDVEKPKKLGHAPVEKTSPANHAGPSLRSPESHRPQKAPAVSSHNEPPTVPETSRLASLHTESCPPGVDRLGCPATSGGEHRLSCPYGWRVSGDACEKVSVPRHAHFEATGFGWVCDSGFIQSGSACTQVQIPAHAHLDATGRAWECDTGFEQQGSNCQ